MVALVVGGDRHDGTGPIAHEHVIGNPDRNALVIDRIDGAGTGENACFLFGQLGAGHVALRRRCLNVLIDGLPIIVGRDVPDEGMLGGKDHVCGPKEGVRTGRVDG